MKPIQRRRLTIACLVLLAAFAPPVTVFAQRGSDAARSRGPGWHPGRPTIRLPSLTAAERATVLERLQTVESLLVVADGIDRPDGFMIRPYFTAYEPRGPAGLASSEYYMIFFYPVDNHEGTDNIRVIFNPTASEIAGFYHPVLNDAGGEMSGEIHFELPVGDPLPGTTTVYVLGYNSPTNEEIRKLSDPGDPFIWALLTSGHESPWEDVSVERYLRAQIRDYEKAMQEAGNLAQTPYEKWLSEAPQRKQEREAILAQIPDATERARLREELEKMEREVGEDLKAHEPEDRQTQRETVEYGNRLRAQLAGLTPEQRAAPAWIGGENNISFVPPGTKHARRAVSLKPDFYRTKGSPADVQAILVHMFIAGKGSPYMSDNSPAGWRNLHAAVFEAYNKLDWAVLRRMLRPAR